MNPILRGLGVAALACGAWASHAADIGDLVALAEDAAGHAVGDEALRLAASTMRSHARHDTLLARYGGEEFVAIMPAEDLPAARRGAERLRLAIEQADWASIPELGRGLTVSIGVAATCAGETFDDALVRADEALYRAKREGRNQVRISLRAA